jgi:hypothetical protein
MLRSVSCICIVTSIVFCGTATSQTTLRLAAGSSCSFFGEKQKKEADTAEQGTDKNNGKDDNEPTHDEFEPYDRNAPARKTSAGTPIIDPLLTEHAFLEREVSFLIFRTNGIDRGTADREEFVPELTWQINNRFEVIASSPFLFRHSNDAENAFVGLGDMSAGIRFLAFDGKNSILAFGANLDAPTGASDHHLGTGYTSIEPAMFWWQDLGNANVLQTELTIDFPVGTHDGASRFHYNFCLTHTFPGTGFWKYFQWLTPTIELNGQTDLDGASSDRTVLNLLPGLIWMSGEKDQVSVSVSFPITAARDFDSQFLISYIHSF